MTVVERFWKFVLTGEGCWPWQGNLHDAGYGLFWLNGKSVLAHRVAFELEVRPLKEREQALHTCDNPPCCRPDHLFGGTNADNIRDCVAKGRSGMQRRTHCPHGHPYDTENTRIYQGRRFCRECDRIKGRRRRATESQEEKMTRIQKLRGTAA